MIIEQLKKAYPDHCFLGEEGGSTGNKSSDFARIIEKHYVDDKKKRKGPDVSSSMDKNELKRLIYGSIEIFKARGGEKKPLRQEKKTIAFAFPSVVSLKKINIGEKLNSNNIFLKRPGGGDFGIKDLLKLYGLNKLSLLSSSEAKNQLK